MAAEEALRRKRQIEEDEKLARQLQEDFEREYMGNVQLQKQLQVMATSNHKVSTAATSSSSSSSEVIVLDDDNDDHQNKSSNNNNVGLRTEIDDIESFVVFEDDYYQDSGSFSGNNNNNISSRGPPAKRGRYNGTSSNRTMASSRASIDDSTFKTEGIAEMIIKLYNKSMPKSISRVICCEGVVFYSTRGTDEGWGCGYKNIQMLCSYLIKFEQFKSALFGGAGEVPDDLYSLQQCIEAAWESGYDPEGAKLLKHRVVNTCKWIGATECASLLRYFGVRAQIVDFLSPKKLQDWVYNYFDNPEAAMKNINGLAHAQNSPYFQQKPTTATAATLGPSSSASCSASASANNNSNSTTTTTTAKKSPKKKKKFLPPLYLQHQGHSRTIIGVEKYASGEIKLLLFDPSDDGAELKKLIQKNGLTSVRRLRKASNVIEQNSEYQIVVVSSTEIIEEPAEKEAYKIMHSVQRFK